MSFRALTSPARRWGLLGGYSLLAGWALAGCVGGKDRSPPSGKATPPVRAAVADAALPGFAPDEAVVLIHSAHDTLGAARLSLEAALRLPIDLPLPFPRIERHADRFRVVLSRGPFAALSGLWGGVKAAHPATELLAAGQAGGDDIIRMAIVCSPADSVPLYAAPKEGVQKPGKELARLHTGQVLALKEEDDGPGVSDEEDEGGESHAPTLSEQGYLTVLQPQVGLVHAPDVLLPADCTPRDEDNDDGNGRILTGTSVGAPKPGQVGRLCLTTRFSGKRGRQTQADLLAVSPNYRRCLRFVGAGTFDGFDHSRDGSHFAVEVSEPRPTPSGPGTPTPALRLYAVPSAPAAGQSNPVPRGQWPGLSRPAFLGDHLIALSEEAALIGVWSIDGLSRRAPTDTSPPPAPRRLLQLPLPGLPALPEKLQAAVHRPAAPTLSGERVKASFLRSCPPELQKRVRTLSGRGFVACLYEIEVEVGLDGTRSERRCRIDNADNPLEEPLSVPCPAL